MNYVDDESRKIFHQSKTLLQMVCQMFESLCYLHGIAPEFIDLVDGDHALMGCPKITEEQADDVTFQLNKQFPRKDDFFTCKVLDVELNIFQIFVTDSKDFRYVH